MIQCRTNRMSNFGSQNLYFFSVLPNGHVYMRACEKKISFASLQHIALRKQTSEDNLLKEGSCMIIKV